MSGVVCWITGLPQSGKSTLARRLEAALPARVRCVRLDGDELREALGAEGYEPADRAGFYTTLTALAALLARGGHVVVVAATAPSRSTRARARALAPRFVEVWVRTSLDDCMARDHKGLYQRARDGQAPHLPGVGARYEAPTAAEVVADGGHDERALAELVAALAG